MHPPESECFCEFRYVEATFESKQAQVVKVWSHLIVCAMLVFNRFELRLVKIFFSLDPMVNSVCIQYAVVRQAIAACGQHHVQVHCRGLSL